MKLPSVKTQCQMTTSALHKWRQRPFFVRNAGQAIFNNNPLPDLSVQLHPIPGSITAEFLNFAVGAVIEGVAKSSLDYFFLAAFLLLFQAVASNITGVPMKRDA